MMMMMMMMMPALLQMHNDTHTHTGEILDFYDRMTHPFIYLFYPSIHPLHSIPSNPIPTPNSQNPNPNPHLPIPTSQTPKPNPTQTQLNIKLKTQITPGSSLNTCRRCLQLAYAGLRSSSLFRSGTAGTGFPTLASFGIGGFPTVERFGGAFPIADRRGKFVSRVGLAAGARVVGGGGGRRRDGGSGMTDAGGSGRSRSAAATTFSTGTAITAGGANDADDDWCRFGVDLIAGCR